MLDPSLLETELNRATNLLMKSKDYIYNLSNKILGLEANLATHTQALINSSGTEKLVPNVTDKFSQVFTDFEDFLGNFTDNTVNNMVSNVVITDTSNSVITPTVAVNVTEAPLIIQPETNIVESIIQNVESDVVNIVHNIDPRLFHPNIPSIPSS